MLLRKRQDNTLRECGVNSYWIVWGNWTSKHCVGHQAKKWGTDFWKLRALYDQQHQKLHKSDKDNQISYHSAQVDCPRDPEPPSLSPSWSNFLALRPVFRIDWKCCCQSPIPFGTREETKPPTTPVLSTGTSTVSWLWIMTDCKIRCCSEVLLTGSKERSLLALSVRFLFVLESLHPLMDALSSLLTGL